MFLRGYYDMLVFLESWSSGRFLNMLHNIMEMISSSRQN